MTVYDDGTGPRLCLGVNLAANEPAVVYWDGQSWSVWVRLWGRLGQASGSETSRSWVPLQTRGWWQAGHLNPILSQPLQR
jgi:hypothetical protein